MFLANPITNLLDNAPIAGNIIEAERTFIGYALNWIRLIGTGVALIMITVMALRYMTANGPVLVGAEEAGLDEYDIILHLGETHQITVTNKTF